MANKKKQIQLEKRLYHEFLKLWWADKFQGKRFGQAFYNYFYLHKLEDQEQLCDLYEKDGDEARKVIGQVFRFN